MRRSKQSRLKSENTFLQIQQKAAMISDLEYKLSFFVLSWQLSKEKLEKHFLTFGKIKELNVYHGKTGNDRRTHGSVTFEKVEDMDALKKKGEVTCMGHKIEIKLPKKEIVKVPKLPKSLDSDDQIDLHNDVTFSEDEIPIKVTKEYFKESRLVCGLLPKLGYLQYFT